MIDDHSYGEERTDMFIVSTASKDQKSWDDKRNHESNFKKVSKHDFL